MLVYTQKFTPEAETPAMYNQERIVKTIEDQLKETDVQKARTKAPLIIEKISLNYSKRLPTEH